MWEYSEAGRLVTMLTMDSHVCVFCTLNLVRLPPRKIEDGQKRLLYQLSACRSCGWWTLYRVHQGEHPRSAEIAEGYSAASGCLKVLDLTDISLPLREVRQYLVARSDKAFEMAPRLLEEVVCSVFRDLGWKARTTAYSGDGGIDVILDGDDGSTVGVQVKRYGKERRIEAEQIRSLAGALMLEGHTKGVFITTSEYRSGAVGTAARYASVGYPIELLNGRQFLEALGVAQIREFDPEDRRYYAYADSPGYYIGTGLLKDLEEGEALCEREIAITSYSREDYLELADEDWPLLFGRKRPESIPEAKFVIKRPEVWWCASTGRAREEGESVRG